MNRQLFVVTLLSSVLPVQAELSLKEVRTASNNVLVAYFQSDIIKADEVDISNLSQWRINGQPVANAHKFVTEADACDHHIYLQGPTLVNGKQYTLQTPYGGTTFTFDDKKIFCESIKTNQNAYSALSKVRYANFAIWLGDGGSQKISGVLPTYTVFNIGTGDQDAQDAWVEMWRASAEHYKDNPIVIGYDLMVEPNANEVGAHALHDNLDIWDPDEFLDQYGGTLYDWGQLYPRITDSIREVDSETPIIIGGMGYSAVDWLPYLEPTGDPRTVYAAHQYMPYVYTHQSPNDLSVYPGHYDLDWDDVDDDFSRAWLDEWLSTVDEFSTTHGVPVMINEFGGTRWNPGLAQFMDDQMSLFEERGLNYAFWEWPSSWEPFVSDNNAFNFLFGPDPEDNQRVETSDLIEVVRKYWGRNTVRP